MLETGGCRSSVCCKESWNVVLCILFFISKYCFRWLCILMFGDWRDANHPCVLMMVVI